MDTAKKSGDCNMMPGVEGYILMYLGIVYFYSLGQFLYKGLDNLQFTRGVERPMGGVLPMHGPLFPLGGIGISHSGILGYGGRGWESFLFFLRGICREQRQ